MISITRYRVWPDGDVQEADTPAHHWKSDDYELVEAATPEDAWAQAKANAPMVPELNYAALCDAAFLQDKRWTQGTTGCVAFTLGAEWYRDQLLATGLHTLYKTNDPEAPATIRDRNGEVVLSLCKVCGKAEGELGEPCHAPAVPQGYEIHEIPADYSGLVWLEGQVRAVARRDQAATGPQGWTDADSDAARLALELECLLMDTKDLSVVSKWWASANEALELHRQRLDATPAPAPAPAQERCSTCGYLTSEREHLGCLRRAVKDLDIATGGPYDAQEVGLTDETQTQDELHSLRLTASGGAYVW